ncbi:serine/threonine protein kinase [Catenulispora sp. MAP5-51]|uniref:serine/threonine-protein kinase n=1 Tax=Catenulispora sp. MAP5-51 TaxID=3156298 RepID=UPI0035167DBB
MNADPAAGQPTTVPETTAPESTPPEMTTSEKETETPEADIAEAGASEPDAEESAEAESSQPEAADGEAPDDEAADGEAASDEAPATAAEIDETEATEAQAADAEPEPEVLEAEAEADEAPALEAEADEAGADEAESPLAPALEAEDADLEPEPEPDIDPEPAAAAAAAATTSPKSASTTPLVAGRYRLVAEIGGGAMGVVWRARDEVLGRDVAVKELRPDHGMSGAQVRTSHQRARREGRIAARLQHPNAVVIYDVAEHDGRPYLIMEYVPSQSLGDILATGAVLTPAEVTSIGGQLASALTAAHERGIVHRDIKPGNVLMTSDGTVKLTDFGISRAAGDATVTATGEILGTPAYTAPEVAQGHPVAFPADVFSLGATLYAAVEGTPPFGEDANAMATLLRVVRNEIRHPKRSGPLTDTIMWMLSPEPADRPTMKQAWQGLDRLSAKPLPPVGIRALTPETKAFAAPSPTIVVPEAASAKSGTLTPEPAAETSVPLPASVTPPPMPVPAPTPTPRSISSRVTAPASEPASTPTSKSSPIAATPTSAMPSASSTRNTRKAMVPAAAAAEPPASTPPPASKNPAASPASPPPAKRNRMALAIAVCVVGTAVLIVAIVVSMNSGGSHDSPNQPVAHSSTASKPSSPGHSTTSDQPSTAPSSSSAANNPAPPSSASSTASSSAPTSSAPSSTASTSASTLSSDPATFVSNYYALLPGNLTAAWPQMTQAYQDNVAHGFANYQIFWNGYKQVTASDVTATGPNTVVADIHYTDKNGNSTTERTTFGLTKNGNSWQINTSHTG